MLTGNGVILLLCWWVHSMRCHAAVVIDTTNRQGGGIGLTAQTAPGQARGKKNHFSLPSLPGPRSRSLGKEHDSGIRPSGDGGIASRLAVRRGYLRVPGPSAWTRGVAGREGREIVSSSCTGPTRPCIVPRLQGLFASVVPAQASESSWSLVGCPWSCRGWGLFRGVSEGMN